MMPLSMVKEGEPNIIKKVGGKESSGNDSGYL